MRSYSVPPPAVFPVLCGALALVRPEEFEAGVFDSWSACRRQIDRQFFRDLSEFDPFTAQLSPFVADKVQCIARGMV
ncbi:unnamed protein product [Protopolystoma xenopodis]|uniref:Uncharacterized protein n=1 Tax=Protopolystoma xenopodis TaxID=117903 RepID=A0A3S5FDF7_9PLAT|nr:unnamed protein product [Protopolystoma xenopodis]